MRAKIIRAKLYKIQIVGLLVFFNSANVKAEAPAFDGIKQYELDDIARDLSANFNHTTLSEAKPLGRFFGVEAGFIGGLTKSPRIQTYVNRTSPGTQIDKIPHAAGLGLLGVPFGFTFEGLYLPTQSTSDVELEYNSVGLKWAFTHFWPKSPVQVAFKGYISTGKFVWTQTINNDSSGGTPTTSEITAKTSIRGGNVTVSLHLPFLPSLYIPYGGAGLVDSNLTIKVKAEGTATIFDESLTFGTGQTAKASINSYHLFCGIILDLFVAKFALEYGRLFETDKVTGKLSLYF